MSTLTHRGWPVCAFRSAVAVVAILTAYGWQAAGAAAQEAGKGAKSAPAAKAPKADADATAEPEATAPAKAAKKGPAAKPAGAAVPKTTKPAPAAKADEAEPAEAAAAPAPVSYKQELSDADFKKATEKFRREKSNIQKTLRAQAFAAGQEAQFDAYYTEFALPRWTVPASYPNLPDHRRELRNDLLAGKSGPPYDRLLAMALEFMTRYSGPGYHPAVRYNATMILGDLNVQEFPPGTKTPVQPHPGAFKVLAAAVRDSDSDAVRVAALLSLTRHASQAPAGSPIADQLTPMLVGLVKSPPPPGRSAEGHAWLRALAIEVLAALHSVGPNGSVVGLLVGIVGDKSAPVLTRCAAARALGTFDYTDFKGLTAGQLATPLGQLAVEMCTAELARARAGAKAAAKSGSKAMGPGMGPMMMPGGPMSMPMSAPTGGMRGASTPGMSPMPGMGASMYAGPGGQQPAEDEESADRMLRFRRNLKFYLNAARLGLNGPLDSQNGAIRRYAAKNEADPKKLADSQDPEWKFVNEVFTQIQQQIKILDKEEEKLQLIANELTNSRNKLRELLKTGSTTPSPAADKGPAKK